MTPMVRGARRRGKDVPKETPRTGRDSDPMVEFFFFVGVTGKVPHSMHLVIDHTHDDTSHLIFSISYWEIFHRKTVDYVASVN